MRGLLILMLATGEAAAAGTGRTDQVTLTDGSRIVATLTLGESGRLQFIGADRSTIAAERVQYIRFAPAVPAPFRAGVVHRVRLTGDQLLTGELLGLDPRSCACECPGATAWPCRAPH